MRTGLRTGPSWVEQEHVHLCGIPGRDPFDHSHRLAGSRARLNKSSNHFDDDIPFIRAIGTGALPTVYIKCGA